MLPLPPDSVLIAVGPLVIRWYGLLYAVGLLVAYQFMVREELGLDPEELGSPWGAAIFSFMAFAVGAFVPLLPFILLSGSTALLVSIALTAVTLFGVGAAVSLLTGKSAIYTGLRQLAIGAAAAAITYAVGSLIGVNV